MFYYVSELFVKLFCFLLVCVSCFVVESDCYVGWSGRFFVGESCDSVP